MWHQFITVAVNQVPCCLNTVSARGNVFTHRWYRYANIVSRKWFVGSVPLKSRKRAWTTSLMCFCELFKLESSFDIMLEVNLANSSGLSTDVFCVHFCGVFVCIWGHFYVHLGGVFVAILWLFCVHFSQFCDLMGIQILHNIRLWHHMTYIFAARMAEYISAFRYILNT